MFIHTKFIQICWWCQWCPTSSDSHLNIINHAAMARPTIQISTQAWFVKRQLGTRYDSTSHSTTAITMPSLCHHYATMPFPPGPWTSMDSMPLRLLCRAHRTLGIVRPFWFLAPWWRCVDLAGWSSFVQPHLEKKLHNVAFHVNKVQHGPAKKN